MVGAMERKDGITVLMLQSHRVCMCVFKGVHSGCRIFQRFVHPSDSSLSSLRATEKKPQDQRALQKGISLDQCSERVSINERAIS
jgi:hypothetical protein